MIGLLCLALSTASAADQLQKTADTFLVVSIVATAALVTVVVLLVRNAEQKRTVTGCVNTAPNGLTLTSEKDKRTYVLTGNLPDVKPNERMKLQLKKVKLKNRGSDALTWQTVKIAKDFGICQS